MRQQLMTSCRVPPNLHFIIDDAEDVWVYSHKFDYIHARLMAGSFEDWPKFFRQAFKCVGHKRSFAGTITIH